jgi:hypothetical protein
MSEYRRSIVLGVLIAVIATSGVAIELNNLSIPSMQASSSGTSRTFSSGVFSNALQLEVTLNSTSINSKGAISVHMELVNTLNQSISFSGVAPNDDIFQLWGPFSYYCFQNPSDFLVGGAVFQGHYTPENISAAPVLWIAAPTGGPPGCGQVGVHFPTTVTFLPNGDRVTSPDDSALTRAEANLTTGQCVADASAGGCLWVPGPSLDGYWNSTAVAGGNETTNFVYFLPGEYTIVAADDWNQYVYATFVVEL